MFTGTSPFSGGPSYAAILAIVKGRRPSRPTHPTFTDKLWTLTQRCWDKELCLRPEVSEILQILLGTDVDNYSSASSSPRVDEEMEKSVSDCGSVGDSLVVDKEMDRDDFGPANGPSCMFSPQHFVVSVELIC